MRPIKGISGRTLTVGADLLTQVDHSTISPRVDLGFTSLSVRDAVRSAAIGGEMTDHHHRIRSRKLLLRKPYRLRYAVIAGLAAAACCGLQWPAMATASTAAAQA